MWNELFHYLYVKGDMLLLHLAESAIALALLYIPYTLTLRKEHFFRQNRLTLIVILLLSLALPFCDFHALHPGNLLPQTTPEIVPTAMEEPQPMRYPTAEPIAFGATDAPQQVAFTEQGSSPISFMEAIPYLCILYIIGVLVAIAIRLGQFIRMDRLIRRGCLWSDCEDGITIYCHASDIAPYSWMRRIVISQHDYDNHRHEILLHERGHVLCRHSWDILLLILVQTVQWYNPFAYMLGASLRDVHEYEADDYVLRQGVSASQYQILLLKTAVGNSAYSFANNFNHSKIKSRIVMMKNKKSNPWRRCKALCILPLILVSLSLFATPDTVDPVESNIINPVEPDSVQNYPFRPVENLDEALLVYDGKVVNEEEFVRLVKEDWGPYDVAYVVNKHLRPHAKKLFLHTLRYYKENEELKIAEQLLHRYTNSKALAGAVVIVKNNATSILGFNEKEQSYDPYNAVSSYNFLLVGTVPQESKDVAFMISLGDVYGKINEENAHTVPVKDGKFVYQTYIAQPTKALIHAVRNDGSLSDTYTEQIFVPNNTLNLLAVGNKYQSKSVPMTLSERSTQTPKREEQLKEVAMQGKQKEKKLFSRGARVPGIGAQLTPAQIGQEVGSAITIDHPTEIREFSFDVLSCNIKDAMMGINIYRADSDTTLFIGPHLVNIEQGKKHTIYLRPVELFVLEPGEYIISVGLFDCDEKTKALWANSHQWDEEQRREMAKRSSLQLPFYVKESYIRRDASDTFEKRNINAGLMVKGVEY